VKEELTEVVEYAQERNIPLQEAWQKYHSLLMWDLTIRIIAVARGIALSPPELLKEFV
jgi:hypothetical protein